MKNYEVERITNRILINVGIGFASYILLWVMYAKLAMPNMFCFILGCCFLAGGIVCACLAKFKELPLKNYATMFFAFTAAMIYMKLSIIIAVFIGIHRCAALHNITFFKILLNMSVAVKTVAILGVVYLVLMFIYNGLQIKKIEAKYRNEK